MNQSVITPAAPHTVIRPGQLRKFLTRMAANKLASAGGLIVLFYIIIALFAPWIAPYDPYNIHLPDKLLLPSWDHWMGTDDKGRDLLSRIIYGTRLSLLIGVAAVSIGAIFGVLLGLVAGYYGGWLDAIIMRIMDILLAFPGILLALAIVSALGASLINVMIAVGVFSIPMFARIVRGSTLTVRKLEYIDSIRTLGGSDLRIILVHILPNIMSPIIVQITLRLATAILSAAGLSFLGLGAQPPSAEWGALLSSGRDYMFSAAYLALFPGLAISTLVIGFNLFGDGLRDALDPKLK
ncbi:ABC transporter permease subunit [Paenibacillus sp. LS1]|uniref:ABC transporter permease n=1 Tax=Paenibacillus sp. LS1 TaxID=2992120 RepID=UPI00223095C2|nr:ABC transporter permease subunit [Paenibacillus sp. LS1]MCW3791939.1 ABC transporter permease subunit [Paenibacillus sp. LS1]